MPSDSFLQVERDLMERIAKLEEIVYKGNAIPQKRALNIDEAASYLGVKKNTIYSYVKKRLIPHSKPSGKLLYFDRFELDKWRASTDKSSNNASLMN